MAEAPFGVRAVRELKQDGTVVTFASLPIGNQARTIEFDPISGDLFVSEDADVGSGGGPQARIWRIDELGGVQSFGEGFNRPNGLAFHPSGVMLVTEEATDSQGQPSGNVLAVGGWRNTFKRGDANADGVVNISDAVMIIDWVVSKTPVPPCFDAADADDDSQVVEGDANYLLNFLFSGSASPPAPGPNACGRDPSADLIDCITSSGCAIP